MRTYVLTHLSDGTLLRELHTLLAHERTATAAVLAHIAEVDARRFYLPAGFPSMYAYCLCELHLSEQAAYKRIHAGRAARKFPAIFPALAEGRLDLAAVELLAPHLTSGNAEELLAAAAHRSKSEIEQLLARRFPRPDLPTCVQAISPGSACQLSPERVGFQVPAVTEVGACQLSPGRVEPQAPELAEVGACQLTPGRIEPQPPRMADQTPGTVATHEPDETRPRIMPLGPERFALQLTMRQEMHDKLRHAQALLSHQVPSGDLTQVLERALDALIEQLERAKFAATSKPRRGPSQTSEDSRHIPAQVRRAVWKRDQGRCTFVSDQGRRCGASRFLQFDHIEPYARGGRATISGVRLRCRAHNEYEAERAFGVGFMTAKREAAREVSQGLAREATERDAATMVPEAP